MAISGGAFKKMSQRAMWRGQRDQSQMLESHGMEGLRSNLISKSSGLKINNSIKSTNNNSQKNLRKDINSGNKNGAQTQNKSLGSSILGGL